VGDKWTPRPGVSNVTTVSVGADGTVWCANTAKKLYRREGGGWVEPTNGRSSVVAVGSKDHVWCISLEGAACQLVSGKWTPVDQPKGDWKYTVKGGDGLYEIVRQQFHITDENEVKRIAGIIANQNNIKVMDRIKEGALLKLSY
jgi:hypothetical protein